MEPKDALLVACGAHAAFQAVVTLVVYPALFDLAADDWRDGHERHTRRITLVVGPLYAAVAASCLWLLVAGPRTWPWLLAVTGQAVAVLSTALVAAPTHGRLADRGPDPVLVRRVLIADRVRAVGALTGLAAAFVGVATGDGGVT